MELRATLISIFITPVFIVIIDAVEYSLTTAEVVLLMIIVLGWISKLKD